MIVLNALNTELVSGRLTVLVIFEFLTNLHEIGFLSTVLNSKLLHELFPKLSGKSERFEFIELSFCSKLCSKLS